MMSALLPFEDVDVRLIFPHDVHGHRQDLEIGRKFDLPSLRDRAFGFANYFDGARV